MEGHWSQHLGLTGLHGLLGSLRSAGMLCLASTAAIFEQGFLNSEYSDQIGDLCFLR